MEGSSSHYVAGRSPFVSSAWSDGIDSVPFSSLLMGADDGHQEEKQLSDDVTEFTGSSTWSCRNVTNLHSRAYFAQFERGLFSLAESNHFLGSEYTRPFLPENARYLLKNMRIVRVPSCEGDMRCLHFPITRDEFKILVSFIVNAKSHSKPTNNKLIFEIRNAAKVMEGRVAFDAVRMVKECSKNKFIYRENDSGLFTLSASMKAEFREPMTKKTVIFSNSDPRVAALNRNIIAVADRDTLKVVDLENKKLTRAELPVRHIVSKPSGGFIVGLDTGHIMDVENNDLTVLSNFGVGLSSLKISKGGVGTYIAVNHARDEIFYGYGKLFQTVQMDSPVIDVAINNDDVYHCTDSILTYRMHGEAVTTWGVRDDTVKNRSVLNDTHTFCSVTVDSGSGTVGACSRSACFIVDSRTPVLVGCNAELHGARSFHVSPYENAAVVLTDTGFSTIDMRKPESAFSTVAFTRRPTEVCGAWMGASRLFGIAVDRKYVITCPYLKNPVLEAYELEMGRIVSLENDIDAALVLQNNSLTVFGGYGKKMYVPSCL